MSFFTAKKSDASVQGNTEEHKQSIGNQVMEALGVIDAEDDPMFPEEEEAEIMMPKKNQSQLAAEEMMKQHESICVISPDAIIKGGIEAKDAVMVAGRVLGDIVAATVTCVGERCYIEGNVKCTELQMHGGKIKGNIEADTKAVINGTVEGNVTGKEDVFEKHAAVNGERIRCEVLTVEPGAQIAAKIEMTKPSVEETDAEESSAVGYDVPVADSFWPGEKTTQKIEKYIDDSKAKYQTALQQEVNNIE